MGIVKEIRLHGKKRTIYRMRSPIFSVFYYLSDKYEMEYGMPGYDVVKDNLMRIHGHCYEDYVVETIATLMGGNVRYSHEPEIDGIIVDRKERPMAVVEVKHGSIEKSDISRFFDKTQDLGGKKMIIAKNKKEYENITTTTPRDLIKKIARWKL